MVTNPDRPSGRGMDVQPSPVKQRTRAAGLDIRQPERARDPGLADWLRALGPDVAAVVAYGKLLPADLLGIPRLGFVNVHFSALPEYRGAAPVQRAIMDGKSETGVSIMVLTEGMDEGPLVAVERVAIDPHDTAGTLGERLAAVGAPLLVRALKRYASGDLVPREQDHAAATYAPKITPEEARIDWKLEARAVRDFVRALNPAPGAWTTFRGTRLKVHAVSGGTADLAPGELRANDELVAGTGDGAVVLDEVQPAGKRRMSGAEMERGARLVAGDRLV